MGRVGFQPGVPEQGDPDRWQREGQGTNNQIPQQGGAVMFRHSGHQIAAAHQRQRGGKAGHQSGDGAGQPQLGQHLIDRAVGLAAAGYQHVARPGVAAGGEQAVAERMTGAQHGDEVVLKQGLGT